MSPSIYDDSVTIDRAYFDTLLRRAQSGNGPVDLNGGGRPSVVISKDEYDSLKSIASKYANLKHNLIRGGVTDETVELLSKSDESMQADAKQAVASEAPSRAEATEDGGVSLNWSSPPTSPQRSLDQSKVGQSRATMSSFSRENSQSYSHGEGQRFLRYNPKHPGFTWAGAEEDEEEEANDDDYNDGGVDQENIHILGANYVQPGNNRQQFERECARTLQIMNLPEGTTHADVVGAVRGGQLLDVYLRTHERAVSVSFVHSADARNFLEYTRRNDLYIRNKRVNVKWNDRQFILPWHVARKIATGASRNLALVGYDNRHTEAIIREDLDHIHNLSIVKIEFIAGTCSISLNSVHNAIFARTCMMSRVRYKGKSIQFEADECAQPYPTRKAKGAIQPRKPLQTVTNRFHLLGCDDEEEDDVQNVFQSKKSTMVAA